MSGWNAAQYLKFKEQRTRPAIDLATRIRQREPHTIVDIGCGPGNSTAVLKQCFPEAELLGIDTSPDMVKKAQASCPAVTFRVSDVRCLTGSYDLLFSNACLQWIPDHHTLLPFLMGKLNCGGVLAVQMPMNGEEPLFQVIRELAAEPKWGLGDILPQPNETLTPDAYFNILSGCSSSFESWETKYYHGLPDHKTMVEWVKGTRLRPYLEYLGEERGAAFEQELVERTKEYYPIMQNGEVVLGFRRFFFIACK